MISFFATIAIKLALGLLSLVFVINVTGNGNLAPSSAVDQIQNFVLGGIIGGVIYNVIDPVRRAADDLSSRRGIRKDAVLAAVRQRVRVLKEIGGICPAFGMLGLLDGVVLFPCRI